MFRNALGIELPRVSRDMAKSGRADHDRAKLDRRATWCSSAARAGSTTSASTWAKAASCTPRSTGKDVTVASLDTGYWSGKFMQARRVDGI